ncbi:MAG TPA: S46 family peptidase [Bacteroidota bacterium]|nr:S46 family peptidase [Bacteroidota bacterium]
MHTSARRALAALCLGVVIVMWALPSQAGEGMWTFDNPPRKQLKEAYGFEPTQAWLDHLRLASVRVGDGGSGSFVSPNGLLLTNDHVGRGQLQKLSTKDRDLVAQGFYARTMAEELKCPDLELNVLMSMEDVTARVQSAIAGTASPREALEARRAVTAAIAKEASERTGLKADVVTFYNGGEYWLYLYKRYTDVRLVMAPEVQIAFFGGDPDNFTFPRHDLDITFFRAYENGSPANTAQFLKWKTAGAKEGDLVFVSGHPGSTNRLQTYAQTEYQRDVAYPARLKAYARSLDLLRKYSARGAEQARQAAGTIFGMENAKKAAEGEYRGLLDKNLMAAKFREDKDLRDRVDANPEWKKAYGAAWDTIATVLERQKSMSRQGTYRTLRGRLFQMALQIVQAAEELKKPNGERQAPYQEANLPGLRFRLFSPAPVYAELEELQVADGLSEAVENIGAEDPFLRAALDGRTPEAAAHELVAGTGLASADLRKQLFDGGESAVAASKDPMILLAEKLLPLLNESRKWSEKYVTGPTASAGEAIGKARFAVYGKSVNPDATFTLRLSYGSVKGYPMNGTKAPAMTTLYGLYDRSCGFGNRGAWELPKRFADGAGKLNMSTPLNFVCSCDIIGGNSGSPVVDRDGAFVGLIFDGNIESLPGRFMYDEESNRAVAVHPAGIIECLRKLYNAGPLADELEGVMQVQ